MRRRDDIGKRGEACHLIERSVGDALIGFFGGAVDFQKNRLRVHERHPHQSKRRAKHHRGDAVLMRRESLPGVEAKLREHDGKPHRMRPGRNPAPDAVQPLLEHPGIDHMRRDLGELSAHARRHGPHLSVELALQQSVIGGDRHAQVRSGGGVMRHEQCDPVYGCSLVDGRPDELSERVNVMHDAVLNGGFEPVRKREPADRKRGVSELQHAKKVGRPHPPA